MLILAMIIAVMRSLRGPVFTPLRILAAAYTDLFRAVPTILVILLLGFGAPALQIKGVPHSDVFWAIVALVLVYSAYVAEVYRAGIQSVHPSQVASARALGLSRGKTMRFVVVPQAVRRVIPPLLNDFIGLQKDSALDRGPRVHRGAPRGADHLGRELRLHAVRGARAHLHRDHDPRGALRRLARRAGPAPAPGRGRRLSGASPGAADRGPPQVVRRARGPQGHRPRGGRARGRRADRRVGLGEVDPAPLHQPARAGQRRPGVHRGRGDHRPRGRREPDPPAGRDRVPGVQPVPAHDGAPQRDARADRGARDCRGPRPRRSRPSCSNASGSRTSATTTRTGSRAGSSSGWRSCGRSR